ncbi:hypothetical protein BXO582_12410, partial [Xanthomonas oryzae pv. oryzae]
MCEDIYDNARSSKALRIGVEFTEQMSTSAVQPSIKKRDGRLVSRAALEEMRLMALQRMGEG